MGGNRCAHGGSASLALRAVAQPSWEKTVNLSFNLCRLSRPYPRTPSDMAQVRLDFHDAHPGYLTADVAKRLRKDVAIGARGHC